MSFGRADGSLVFETELDNDGFERGSKNCNRPSIVCVPA